jgi:hypothetical protein
MAHEPAQFMVDHRLLEEGEVDIVKFMPEMLAEFGKRHAREPVLGFRGTEKVHGGISVWEEYFFLAKCATGAKDNRKTNMEFKRLVKNRHTSTMQCFIALLIPLSPIGDSPLEKWG